MDKAVKTQTFVSAETARRIRHQFLLTDMGQYQMKGKDLPVQAFLLERELSDDEAKQARVLSAPLIGRDEEMATLRSAATRSRTGPDGAIALMIGDAGMGKTRLLDEIAAELGDDMLVLRGSGHSVGARPFGLIANVLEPLIEQMADGPDKQIARRSSLVATRPSSPTWEPHSGGVWRTRRTSGRSRSWSTASSGRTRRRSTSPSCSCGASAPRR